MTSIGTLWCLRRDNASVEAQLHVDSDRYALAIYCDGQLTCCEAFELNRGAMAALDAATCFKDTLVKNGWEVHRRVH